MTLIDVHGYAFPLHVASSVIFGRATDSGIVATVSSKGRSWASGTVALPVAPTPSVAVTVSVMGPVGSEEMSKVADQSPPVGERLFESVPICATTDETT